MSLIYCIAADHELPTGSFGKRSKLMKLMKAQKQQQTVQEGDTPLQEAADLPRLYPEYANIYETEEDAAGLYVGGPAKRNTMFPHFRLPFIYVVSPDNGSFELSPKLHKHSTSYKCAYRCVKALFDYLDRNLEPGGEIELYAGWDDGMGSFDEPRDSSLDLIVDLSTFEWEEEFIWREKQYILIRKTPLD